MIEIHITYNGVEVKIKGEAGDVVSVATALNEVVDRLRKVLAPVKK